MKKIFIFIILALIVVVALKFENVSTKINTIETEFNNTKALLEINEENQSLIVYANGLIKDSTQVDSMEHNTEYLQELVDEISDTGGGIVHIPAGTYYFASAGLTPRKIENFVIKCRDNVTVEGEGTNETTGTVFKPYGETEYGLDMFYFNEYAETKGAKATFLENADFRNFVIDSEKAHSINEYNSTGKGFMINLYRNCDWDNVVVKNTDGTGFGMDCPINCTIKNCVAIGCGKRASKESDVGASGFGIGTGYSNDETIFISNCTSIGNKKYGFFFEHQGRFDNNAYKATKAESFVVSNCIASGNMYDFGGARSNDVTYQNCTSNPSDKTKKVFYFEERSRRNYLINCETNQKFNDVTDSSQYYYNPVYWALNNGITDGYTKTEFSPDSKASRAEALIFLWRMDRMPGDVVNLRGQELTNYFTTGYTDVATNAWYVDAVKWAKNEGIIDSKTTTFLPDKECTRAEFITFLWKYAGSPIVQTGNNFSDVEEGASYEKAVNWALNKGILTGTVEGTFLPNNSCTRADIVTFLYRYANKSNEFAIRYNLDGGKLETANPATYKAGTSEFSLNNPTKKGYTFEGWTGSSYSQTGYVGENKYIPIKTVKITTSDVGIKAYSANWTPNIYKVYYYANNGTEEMIYKNFTYNVPQAISKNEFAREGYKFLNWNTKADGTGTTYNSEDIVMNLSEGAKVSLYAQWTKINKKGDINQDSKIDPTDMIKILRHIASMKSLELKNPTWKLDGESFKIADINDDEKVNTTDLLKLLRHISASKNSQVKEKHPDWII